MTIQSIQKIPQLYEQDYLLWQEVIVKQLKQKNVEHLDWENLIEEIEALSIEQKHKVDSYLFQLLVHLLPYKFWETQKQWDGKSWKNEIENFRTELEFLFEKSTTLYNNFLTRIEPVYAKARRKVIAKSGLNPLIFPEECPFTSEQIMKFNYLG